MTGFNFTFRLRNGNTAWLQVQSEGECNGIIETMRRPRPGWATSIYPDGTYHGVLLSEAVAFEVSPIPDQPRDGDLPRT